MTPLETVKAAIAETPDPENREATLREALASTRYPVDGPASDEERDGWQSMARADRILTEAARRAIEAIPKIDRLTRDLAEARAERDAARAVLRGVQWVSRASSLETCPVCLRAAVGGHASDCALAAALGPATTPATPIASGQAGEREAIRAAEIEATAKKIYEGFAFPPGYVPWTVRGNSEKQEEARHLARRAIATRDTRSAPAEPAADRDGGGGE